MGESVENYIQNLHKYNHINGSPKETEPELAKVRSMLRHGVTDFMLKFFSA